MRKKDGMVKRQGQQQKLTISPRTLLQDHILCDSNIQLYGYRMDRIAVAIFLELSLRINAAVDILSVSSDSHDRRSLQAIMTALGGELLLQRKNVETLFADGAPATNVALQAWAACRAAMLDHMAPRYAPLPRIATDTLPDAYLSVLAKISRHADISESLKPTKVINDVKGDFIFKKGNVNLECTRFRTRIMSSKNQVIQIETQVGDRHSIITGRAQRVKGRQAHINVNGTMDSREKIVSVTTVGKESLTAAESYREDVVRQALQGTVKLTGHPFFCSIWMPSFSISQTPLVQPVAYPLIYYPGGTSWPPPVLNGFTKPPVFYPPICYPGGTLNVSQNIAVRRIISEAYKDRVVMIQGPPGTGKTTVIAASVMSIIQYDDTQKRTIWLVAQSNVAVKNIAEKLDKVGFRDFKLLVSMDFHFDWHEHLYERLAHCLIRSDEFGDGPVAASRRILDSRVMLCTLSMLSNPRIDDYTRLVPMQTVIIDEASQIEVGDYLPVLQRFRPTLQKMVFIGDDKQLAPFGQDDVQQLQSVFEFPHLRQQACFLNTQYRMPVVVGDFISRHIYDHQLMTVHDISSRAACRFVDVKMGQENKSGHSWVNEQEIQVIIHLARLYSKLGRQYKVLTPYDAQSVAIEKQLESEDLPWEDKCFNVDSFQGNEEDHIIVSLVRTEGVGFLKNVRRMNVMLTRCKKSMIICTSRNFVMAGKAADTLVGKLAAAMGPEGWLGSRDILRGVLP
ncbi:hypothetical protein AZE42_03977 [Rhizopogon vesiculosus]|uniref:DNA2/NAM7 helicase-like C-terminal domain-containing protein n=1 Tax=Rhizopogon vesiculosus TaxID=180088 RepID=A0A1J8PYV1_9AGAM|nr:hypothetical protein AZE42_03977 [Rhizopogon vesiculosus]